MIATNHIVDVNHYKNNIITFGRWKKWISTNQLEWAVVVIDHMVDVEEYLIDSIHTSQVAA